MLLSAHGVTSACSESFYPNNKGGCKALLTSLGRRSIYDDGQSATSASERRQFSVEKTKRETRSTPKRRHASMTFEWLCYKCKINLVSSVQLIWRVSHLVSLHSRKRDQVSPLLFFQHQQRDRKLEEALFLLPIAHFHLE